MQFYLSRTKEIRGDRKKLFIAIKTGHSGEIHANTISSWITKTIKMAYENSTEADRNITGVKAHQVRALSASWAFHKNNGLDSIMRACSWKAHSTFTNYYLKDMCLIGDAMLRLGPLVAAQQITN